MSSLAYRAFRIGFLSVFHTLYEGWIVQNQIEDWMPTWMNHQTIRSLLFLVNAKFHTTKPPSRQAAHHAATARP